MNDLVLSYSSLNDFILCPKKFKLQYKNKAELKKIQKSGLLNEGSFQHKFLEDYVKHCIKNNFETDISYFNELFEKVLIDFKVVLNPKEIEDCRYILRKWVENNIVEKNTITEQFITITKELESVTYFDKKAFFCGIIDKIVEYEDEIHIIDYKGGWSKENDSFQLKCYSLLYLALSKKYNKKIRIFFDYTRFGFKEEIKIDEFDYLETIRLLEYYYDKITNMINGKEQFYEFSNDYCAYCMFKNQCFKNLVGEDNEKIDITDITKFEKNFFYLESVVSQMKESLKTYYKNNGDIFFKHGLWTNKETEEFKILNDEAFFETLKLAGLNPFSFYAVTNTNIKKALNHKKMSDFKELLEEMIQTNKKLSFEFVKDLKSLRIEKDYEENIKEDIEKENIENINDKFYEFVCDWLFEQHNIFKNKNIELNKNMIFEGIDDFIEKNKKDFKGAEISVVKTKMALVCEKFVYIPKTNDVFEEFLSLISLFPNSEAIKKDWINKYNENKDETYEKAIKKAKELNLLGE
jgi:CRISPR/Cas system-associated exonuclease Cas4 (RecB family)